jgi:hypothetical protein
MSTKQTRRPNLHNFEIEWDRAADSGRLLGGCLHVYDLSVTLHVQRPTPYRSYWVGFSIFWKGRALLDTFPLPKDWDAPDV